jgi:DNA-binding transcriptional regulator YdaS (Cro superfamily)
MQMLDEVVEWYGSQAAMARALGVERSAVAQWLAKGELPALRALQIEKLSGGRFRAVDLSKI